MSRCPNCGAPIADKGGSSYNKPAEQQGYIPGGGQAQQGYAPGGGGSGGAGSSGGSGGDQPGMSGGSRMSPPPRPAGSLGRRLQAHGDASSPNPNDDYGARDSRDRDEGSPRSGQRSRPRADDRNDYDEMDDRHPPERGGARSRLRGDERGSRSDRGASNDMDDREYGQPRDRRRPSSGSGRSRGRDDVDSSEIDENAMYGGRGDGGRSRPPARPAPGRRPPADDESVELEARRDGRRSGPPRRSADPDPEFPAWDESSDAANDPRGSNRGASGRGGPRYDEPHYGDPRDGGRRGGAPAGRYDEPSGYTDERPAPRGYQAGVDAFSAEYEAQRRGGQPPRGPGGSGRGPSRYDDGGYGSARRDPRAAYDAGGDMGWDAPSSRGAAGPAMRGARGGFAESDIWQPGAPPIEVRRGAPDVGAQKSGGNTFRTVFAVVVGLLVVVGLIAAVGPNLAPKFSKYLPFLKSANTGPTAPAFATYTPGFTPTAQANDKTYVSPDGYAMDYPVAWGAPSPTGAGTSDSIMMFVSTTTAEIVEVERPSSLDSATDAQLIQSELNGSQKNGVTLTEVTSAATTEGIGGEIWQRHEYTFSDKNGDKLHMALIVCHHLGKAYAIILFSADSTFASDDTSTFEPMLRSFRFV